MYRAMLRLGVTVLMTVSYTLIFGLLLGSARFTLSNIMPDLFFTQIIIIYAVSNILRNWKISKKILYARVEKQVISNVIYNNLKWLMTAMILAALSCLRFTMAYDNQIAAFIDFAGMIYIANHTSTTLTYCLFQDLIPYEQAIAEMEALQKKQNK